MKPVLSAVLIAALCLVVLATVAGAQYQLSLYSDAALTNCTLSDTSPHIAKVYAAEFSDEATATRFRIAADAGFTGVWLSETSPFFTVGNSRTDLSIGFGNCMVGQFLILEMTYQFFGTSACSTLSFAAAPGTPEPLCTACSFGEVRCSPPRALHVNCDGSFDCNPVATEPTTWGKVKSLYRD